MIPVPPRAAAAWAAVRRRLGDSSEFEVLSRSFLARFFENDITGGSSDLKTSFFWLIAFLAAPGLLVPVLMSFNWTGIALVEGTEGLRIAARGDKAFYLGFAMVASGLISTVTWNSLLLDRRDCLVLGPLPVRGAQMVRAKLTALCTYVLLVAVGMHAGASLSYGFFLAAYASLSLAWAGAVAHMFASCAASAFVLLTVAATQGLAFAVLGPRRFTAVSPWLQSGVVAVILLGMLALPTIDSATVPTLTGADYTQRVQPWILETPPLWFLGVYESLLRADDPIMLQLRTRAVLALVAAALVTLVTYPLAYRRLVASVVEMPAPASRHGWLGRAVEWTVASVSRDPRTRASSQFFLTAIRRSLRHRFAMAIAAGTTAAVVSPALFRWAGQPGDLPTTPPIDLLALPFEAIAFMLIGLRIAAALPADLNATWQLDGIGARTAPLRAGLWRTMFVMVVLPISILAAAFCGYTWGGPVAIAHGLLCIAFGAAVVEAVLWGFEAMPCSLPWRPEHANLRTWWPAWLAVFLFVSGGLPALEQIALDGVSGLAALIGAFVTIALVLRITHHRRRIIPESDLDEPQHVQVLNLD